jgi:hypothetical protein
MSPPNIPYSWTLFLNGNTFDTGQDNGAGGGDCLRYSATGAGTITLSMSAVIQGTTVNSNTITGQIH